MEIDSWLDIIRREAQHVLESSERKSTLVATAYNPDTHSVKGILVPHGVETGWVPIATHHIGNGWGLLTGPKVGDPQKLDGDQFDVEFEFGDPNTPVARHRVFSNPDKPPRVESGEILVKDIKGNKIFYKKDGTLTIVHFAVSGEITFAPSGALTIDAKDKDVTVQTTGQMNINGDNVIING